MARVTCACGPTCACVARAAEAKRARWRCVMLALSVLRSAHVVGGKKARKLVKRVLALPCMQRAA